MGENKKISADFRRWLSLVLAAVVLLGMTACSGKKQEPLRAPTEAASATASIETVYGTLAFPEELFPKLRHMEVTEGAIAMEIFYMIGQEGEKELFRIHYADAQAGTHMGYLTTDGGEIPVSYSICEYSDEDFQEEDRELYYGMMNAFSVIMNSIHDDPRFSETRKQEPVAERDVKLRYWKVTLPENVQYEESQDGDTYRVEFYGEVSGERIDLFMVGLGELEAETMLGLYTVDGVQKPVMVQTGDLSVYDIWPEEERMIINQMMEALNTVVQTIVADENFAEPTSGN